MDEVKTRDDVSACSTCFFLSRPCAVEDPDCSIRDVAIRDPRRSFCANHPDHRSEPDRTPVGLVLSSGDNGRSVLYVSPDRKYIRGHLLDIAERVEVRDLSELTFKEATALWQLEVFRERRAYVHFDRIELLTAPRAGRRESLDGMLAKGVFRQIVGKEPGPSDPDVPLLEKLTIQGRLLQLSTLIAGALAFYGMLTFLYENAPAGTWIPWFVVALLSILAGGAFLAGGFFVFKRMGIPFWVRDRDPTGSGPARPAGG